MWTNFDFACREKLSGTILIYSSFIGVTKDRLCTIFGVIESEQSLFDCREWVWTHGQGGLCRVQVFAPHKASSVHHYSSQSKRSHKQHLVYHLTVIGEKIHLAQVWAWGHNFKSLGGECAMDICNSTNELWQLTAAPPAWCSVTYCTAHSVTLMSAHLWEKCSNVLAFAIQDGHHPHGNNRWQHVD